MHGITNTKQSKRRVGNMNQLEEKLGIVQRQIKVLKKQMEETDDLNEQYRISRQIQDLNVEEYELLEQLGVKRK